MSGSTASMNDRVTGPRETGRPRLIALVEVLLTIALLGAVGYVALGRLNPAPKIDQAAATTLARDFFAHAHGEGAMVSNLQILTVWLGSDDTGRWAWRVNISGDVTTGAGSDSPSYTSYMWLYVDAETGAVRTFAQG